MAYIACKPVRFDRDYAIGEKIPGSVVSPDRAAAIVAMGLIDYAESAQNGAEGVEPVGGVNGQAEAENATESAQGVFEGVSEASGQRKKTRGKKKGE